MDTLVATNTKELRTVISFVVYGTPAPQGSKRHVGKGIMVESSMMVKPWREAVKTAAHETRNTQAMAELCTTFTGPLTVTLHFYLSRPKGHYGTGRNTGQVKDSSPRYPAGRPDLDKLVRSTLDALTESGLIHDDSQIVALTAWKDYCDLIQDTPGVFITIEGAT